MKPTTSNSTGYTPGQAPDDTKEFQRYMYNELLRISAVLNAVSLGHLDKTTVAPTKPRDGDVRYADGVNWLPNGAGGVGIWYYKSATSTWVQLG